MLQLNFLHKKISIMNKKLLFLLITLTTSSVVFAQNFKPKPKSSGRIMNTQLNIEANTPTIEPVFQATRTYKTLPQLPAISDKIAKSFKVLTYNDGIPTMIGGEAPTVGNSRDLPLSARCQQYLEAAKTLMFIQKPFEEFELKSTEIDEMGNSHIRMVQKFKNLPVWGSEVILHERGGKVNLLNGSYFPTPSVLSIEPTISLASSIENVKTDLAIAKPIAALDEAQLNQVGGAQSKAELVVFHVEDKKDAEHLAWHVTMYQNVLHRWEYFVDAQNGQILDKYESSCNIMGHIHEAAENCTSASLSEGYEKKETVNTPLLPTLMDGAAVANSTDLLSSTRTINTYQVGTKYYLIDASRTMFKATQSTFPNKPVGVIQTFDNKNTDGGTTAYYITSTNNAWADPKAVSAHYNAGEAYTYFKNTFGRNSINGSGGNVNSFINVTEDDIQMDNAYWNGEAMYYGNGKDAFTALPKALDVAGHEISHGVIQNTANLKYQGESGAMNESFADIFGAMIDRANWTMGEQVVNRAYFPSGALRDLANPNNGTTQGKNGWQPKNVSEQYKGTQDNGGVHINSGITNYAFYLFATNANVTKVKAERVYYQALTKYLVASSKFIDLRAAVEQSCKDLYAGEPAVLTAAQTAFNTVGIGSGGSTTGSDYQKDIPTNPGQDWMIYVSQETSPTPSKLILQQPSGTSKVTLYSAGVKSRPSITDDGRRIVFVGADTKIYYIDINWTTGVPTAAKALSTELDWNNIAISKDGVKIAANAGDSLLYVFNIVSGQSKTFRLYNPTTSSGTAKTYDVRFSDALEWDNTGENVMYDAFTSTPGQGANLEYYDIGFINVWSNAAKGFGTGVIDKLFSGVPENTDIGNPTFAKNSPYIIAFDYLTKNTAGNYDGYYIVGANIQTGDITTADVGIFANTTVGYPSFSNKDDKLLFTNYRTSTQNLELATIGLTPDKINAKAGDVGSGLLTKAQKGYWFSNGIRSTTAVNEQLDNSSVVIAPNPFREILTVEIQSEKSAVGKAEIFDLVGRNILSYPLSISGGKNPVSINTQALQAGAYLLRVTVDGKSLTKKIIKL
jgi:Zn-dependent metalloprotease